MHVVINGESKQFDGPLTVEGLVRQLGVNPQFCAVERNLELVPRKQHAQVNIVDGDHLEVVTLVGGG